MREGPPQADGSTTVPKADIGSGLPVKRAYSEKSADFTAGDGAQGDDGPALQLFMINNPLGEMMLERQGALRSKSDRPNWGKIR